MVFRIIARLDVKPPNLVKGAHMEGYRVVGDPVERALEYYAQGVDEIFYQDVVASLFGLDSLVSLVSQTAREVFVPITVSGGIRTIEDIELMLRSGADKVAINTAAIEDPKFITNAAKRFGSQAIVVSVEAQANDIGWQAMTNCGRENTGKSAIEWVAELEDLGAGEVVITSIRHEGTGLGADQELIQCARENTNLSLIAHGGISGINDVLSANATGANGVAIARAFHHNLVKVNEIKHGLTSAGIEVRP